MIENTTELCTNYQCREMMCLRKTKKANILATPSKTELKAADAFKASRSAESIGTELKLTPRISMFINIGNCQNQGARTYQEDAFGYSNIVSSDVITNNGILAVLSDGMGGLKDGKIVSEYVVQGTVTLLDSIDPRKPVSPQLEAILNGLNENVCGRYASDGKSSAGATAVIAYIYKNRIYWAAVGDSRIYCLRKKHMLQMNEDHDYKNKLFRKYLDGEAELDEAENNPQKDSLISFIGREGMPCIDSSIKGFKIRPNDTFVLCSDGVYNGITEDTMREILLSNDAQSASEKIIDSVLAAGFPGQDNMTVMVIKCSKACK